MAALICVNIGSSYNLLPDGKKIHYRNNVDFSLLGLYGIRLREISQ